MKRILIVLMALALFTGTALAQPTCVPSNIGGAGTPWLRSSNAAGVAIAYGCPDGTSWLWALRWSAPNRTQVIAGLLDVPTAADKVAAVGALVMQYANASEAELIDIWEPLATWVQFADEGQGITCTVPCAVRYGAGTAWSIKVISAMPAGCDNATFGDPAMGTAKHCEKPLRPTFAAASPPPVIYVVTGAQAFPLKADGTKSTTAWPVAPTKGDACDPSVKVVSYGATFMKVPSLSTASQVVVAGCSLKK